MDYDDDNADYWRARAVNLQYADKGFRLCDTCEGIGVTMIARMTGSGHTECEEYCPDCGGDGQVEIKLKASVSRNKSEGWYAGHKPWFWGCPRTRTKDISYSLKFFNADTKPLLEGTYHARD